jgi:phage shock protein E
MTRAYRWAQPRNHTRGALLGLALWTTAAMATDGAGAPSIARVGERYLIDVRTQAEWLVDHVPGAVLIPHDRIAEFVAAALPDRSAPIGLYCRTGRRSGEALRTLQALGYTDVVNYGGLADARARVAVGIDCAADRGC